MADQDDDPGRERALDSIAAQKDFTKQCHELAPKLFAMISEDDEETVRGYWKDYDLSVRDAWAQLAAWHLRQILKTKEAVAKELFLRRMNETKTTLETNIPDAKPIEITEILDQMARLMRGRVDCVHVIVENTAHGIRVDLEC